MDDQINSYIESLVLETLESPQFTNLSQEEKQTKADQIREYVSSAILDTVIDSLSEEQLKSLENIPSESPEMEQKIEEFSSQIPSFSTKIESVLRNEIEKLKLEPKLLDSISSD